MAAKPLKTSGKKKQPSAVETSESIENQVEDFLKAGGKIEQVSSGVSGQQSMMPKPEKPAKPVSSS